MTDAALNLFHPVEEPGTAPLDAPTLLLLHGTGGSERDLVPLAKMIAPDHPLLGVRGQVNEGGAARFFRRFGEGLLDLDDLRARADDLLHFLRAKNERDGRAERQFLIIGFSNGANMGTALLQLAPSLFVGGILIRAMWSLALEPTPDLRGQEILLLNGASDPLVSRDQVIRLTAYFSACGANVQQEIVNGGHGLTPADISLARDWFSLRRDRPGGPPDSVQSRPPSPPA